MLFVSHANPEDNEFAKWLSLRLAAEGYPVWCDLTRLLGGERFWSDIETAIRTRTSRFLFVLSRASNQKEGPLDELHLALATKRQFELEDFVVPLWIDDLPASEFNVRLGGINAIPFRDSWAAGLARLSEKLDEVRSPRDSRFGHAAVGRWWLENISASEGLSDEPEPIVTNVYPVDETELWVYRPTAGSPLDGIGPAAPARTRRGRLAAFVPPDRMAALNPNLELDAKLSIRPGEKLTPPEGWRHSDLRHVVTGLLNDHWRLFVSQSGLHHHSFSGGQPAVFETLGGVGLGRVNFVRPDTGVRTHRQLIGYKTIASQDGKPRRRYWHFAVEPRPMFDFGVSMALRAHVVFSDDGHEPWPDDGRQHRARRSQCKDWWNDKWRDLLQASISHLAAGAEALDLSANNGGSLSLLTNPLLLVSPVSYGEPSVSVRAAAPDQQDTPEPDDLDEGLD